MNLTDEQWRLIEPILPPPSPSGRGRPPLDRRAVLTRRCRCPLRYASGVLRDAARAQARFATPEELADFFLFLCSPRASYCAGSTYYVDGGWLNVVA